MTNWSELFAKIEVDLPNGGQWCTPYKAGTLASLIIGLRPTTIVEIGVWMGGSLVPMALAMKALASAGIESPRPRKVIGIDAWDPKASVQGQRNANEQWWGSVDHDMAFRTTRERLEAHRIDYAVYEVPRLPNPGLVELWHCPSSDVPRNVVIDLDIDLLHIDGNHAEQAIADVEIYARRVQVGGICVMDDIHWEGGHVENACTRLQRQGFTHLYDLDTGAVYQRVMFR